MQQKPEYMYSVLKLYGMKMCSCQVRDGRCRGVHEEMLVACLVYFYEPTEFSYIDQGFLETSLETAKTDKNGKILFS